MDFFNALKKAEPHQRTIIHLDMDYYYAQVEEIRDPQLRNQPVGVQQKNIVVTCNYIARRYGVTKLMLVNEAKRLCPALVLVNGEDLTPYRQMSQRISELLLNYTPAVEKLGLDENYLDVSALVEQREQLWQQRQTDGVSELPTVEGHIYPADGTTLNACDCGCATRLAIGTQLAKEIRMELFLKLSITCCAGVSYNKLLAKLVGAQNKPNEQTVLVSAHTEQFMRELHDLHRITGIGQKTATLLLENGISSVEELQNADMDMLRKKLGFETATKLKELAFGKDNSTVRASGKPKSIGLEDSCKPISVRRDVEERFRLLLMRLVEQVAEDGRIPIAIKIMLRKYDAQKKTSHRETKQLNISPSLFKANCSSESTAAKIVLAEGANDKLLKIIMRLFERIVDMSKPFNITLLGLAFSKFQQRKVGSSSIANFLIKKTDLEVQSITSLTNTDITECNSSSNSSSSIAAATATATTVANSNANDIFRSSPTTFRPIDQYRRRTNAASPVPTIADNGSESGATNSDFSDFSETEIEPSPKKSRLSRLFLAKRRCLGSSSLYTTEAMDVSSPSKLLRVRDLRLSSRDSEKDLSMSPCSTPTSALASNNSSTSFLSAQRFRAASATACLLNQRCEAMEVCRTARTTPSSANSSPLPSPMDESVNITNSECCHINNSSNLSNIPCPANVDPEVFNQLPLDVQNELIDSWRSSLAAAAAAAAVATGAVGKNTTNANAAAAAKVGGATANGSQKNTLYRYFLRNK